MYGSLVHVVGTGMERRKEEIAAELRRVGVAPGPMTVIEPSLEDVFIACMR